MTPMPQRAGQADLIRDIFKHAIHDRGVRIGDCLVDSLRALCVRLDLGHTVGIVAAVAHAVGIVEVLVIQFGDLRGASIRRVGRLGLMVVLCAVIVCPIGRCAAGGQCENHCCGQQQHKNLLHVNVLLTSTRTDPQRPPCTDRP